MTRHKTGWRISNCLIFVAIEAIKKDKYIVIRKTRHRYKWPFCKFHFLVVPKKIIDEYAESYVPEKDDLGEWPCPLFKGFIKKGDE